MRGMSVESVYQRWSFQNEPNSCVAMAVDPSFVALGQAKPTLQFEIVSDLFKRALADEEASEKARHHLDHLPVCRVLSTLEAIDQSCERLLPIGARASFLLEGRGDCPEC